MFQLHIQFILVEFKDFFFHLFQSNIYKLSKLGQYLLALLRILKGKVIFELLLDFLLKLIIIFLEVCVSFELIEFILATASKLSAKC